MDKEDRIMKMQIVLFILGVAALLVLVIPLWAILGGSRGFKLVWLCLALGSVCVGECGSRVKIN